jgi:catalase
VKRLGGPNFTHIPINAPKCPFHNFQQDGHMAIVNPKGRANYEPNSWGGIEGGPRESHEIGFRSFPAEEKGRKVRERSESFADHYSQARQFYVSQTKVEQGHIAEALIFRVKQNAKTGHSGASGVALAKHRRKAGGQGRERVGAPGKSEGAAPCRRAAQRLEALQSAEYCTESTKSFAGRKVGTLLTDGVDRSLFDALKQELEAEGAMLEIIAPSVGGVDTSDGTRIEADQKIGGGPSVFV